DAPLVTAYRRGGRSRPEVGVRCSGGGTAGGAPELGASGPYPPMSSRLRSGGVYPPHGSAADHGRHLTAAATGSGGATSMASDQIGYRGPTACAAAGI